MRDLLKTHFGFDGFLPLQEEIIGSVMDGKDAFVLMPTGGGKSLCYQLPALALDGLTLVISPLISLMKDQVDALKTNGINAEFINSSLDQREVAEVGERAHRGQIKILYVAPERAALPGFQAFLKTLHVSLIAIDEAHCVSEWGHEFRPAYRELHGLREVCLKAPVIALTATATRRVRGDVLSQLGLREPQIFASSFDRPNLTYSVEPKTDAFSALLGLVKKHQGESAIVYCLSRRATEETAQSLSQQGFHAEPYHGGMEANDRRDVQERFIRDQLPIVVATIAFGMGIDKPDVRLVVHYDMPKSVEGYYQETGRAGRDGMPSECVLFYAPGDRAKHEYFINQLEDDDEKERARDRVRRMLDFCTLTTCRRTFLLEYLGEEWPQTDCGNCDVCVSPRESFDATESAQMLLSAVVRTGQRFGAAHVINVLRGSKSKPVEKWGHHELPLFGIGKQRSESEFRDIVPDLVNQGLLARADGEYPTLSVPPKGREFLRNRESLTLTRAIRKAVPRSVSPGKTEAAEGDRHDLRLYEELAALRMRYAEERRVPAYVIFGNRSLQEMAQRAPMTREEFLRISGVGEAKLREFGDTFIDCIANYVQKHGQLRILDPVRTVVVQKTPRVVGESIRATGRAVSEGRTLEEVADLRGLALTTILGHLERLINEGVEVRFDHLMPSPARCRAIESAFEDGGQLLLKPVMDLLGDLCSYEELRVVRLWVFQRRREEGQSPDPGGPHPGPVRV